jgi:hypothetical protein
VKKAWKNFISIFLEIKAGDVCQVTEVLKRLSSLPIISRADLLFRLRFPGNGMYQQKFHVLVSGLAKSPEVPQGTFTGLPCFWTPGTPPRISPGNQEPLQAQRPARTRDV